MSAWSFDAWLSGCAFGMALALLLVGAWFHAGLMAAVSGAYFLMLWIDKYFKSGEGQSNG
jgi:predicted membrane metal-binding protein